MKKPEATQSEVEAITTKCLYAFSNIEMALTSLFLTLNNTMRDAGEPPHERHPLAAAFDSIQSFDTRLTIIHTFILADARLDVKFKAAWNTLYNNIDAQRRRRNQLGHFSLVHRIVPQPDSTYQSRYLIQPYFAISKIFTNRMPKPLSFDMLCARKNAFNKTKERIIRLTQYIRVTRDNALIAGRPVTDPARLLQPEAAQSAKGNASQTRS